VAALGGFEVARQPVALLVDVAALDLLGARDVPLQRGEDVDVAAGVQELRGELAHTVQIGQFQRVHLDAVDAVQPLAGDLRAPGRHHHVRARPVNARVVSRPGPEYPPVTTASRPVRSIPRSTSAAVLVAPNPEPIACRGVSCRRG
jgi:hypothetical protein